MIHKHQSRGYVIINTKDNNRILSHTYRFTKNQCLKDFVKGSGEDWKYWREKYKFKCVNANITIETN